MQKKNFKCVFFEGWKVTGICAIPGEGTQNLSFSIVLKVLVN